MPADSDSGIKTALSAEDCPAQPRNDARDAVGAALPAAPVKPKRKRAPRPTFDDGALTRVFKFPCRKYPKSSYYVTGSEIIIRIKKARRKWKLVVPKKRMVAYRTNRWFAKPRWVEIELTYTQAVRFGLVEPSTRTLEPAASDIASVAGMPVGQQADDACEPLSVQALDEQLEPGLDEVTGWVADDDAAASSGDDQYDTFEDAGEDEAATGEDVGAVLEMPNPAHFCRNAGEPVPIPEEPPALEAPVGALASVDTMEPVADEHVPATDRAVETASPLDVECEPTAPSVPAAPATAAATVATAESQDVAPDPFAQRPQDRSADAGDQPVELPLGSRRRTSYSRPGMQIAAVVLAAIMLGLSADLLGNDGDRADAVACAQTTPASCAPDAIVTGSLPAPPPDAAAAPDTTAVAAAPVEAPVEAQETAAEKGLDTTAPARAAPPALPDAGSQPAHVRLAPVEVQVPGEAKAGQEEERARPVEVEVAAAAPPETPAAVQRNEPDGCPAIAISTARDTVVRFGFASAVIPEAGLAVLDQLAVALRRCPDVHVLIEGHSDSDGDHFRNQSLSVRRAFAVRQQLIEGGAAPVQLFVVGYGDARPLAPNDSIENKARNRRIEVVVR